MKEWNFPTGEYGVEVDDELTISWDWTTEKDVFKILCKINALAHKYQHEKIILNVPYLPYSRQDRIFNIGEALCLEVLLNTLAACCLRHQLIIKTMAVHNPEATRFYCKIHGIEFINTVFAIDEFISDIKILEGNLCDFDIIFPDKHAIQHFMKTDHMSDLMHYHYNQYFCSKIRGECGHITHLKCDDIAVKDVPIVIMDDICDGGATFIKCAEALREQGIEDIRLFVYHGFFTKGLQPLFDAGIKKIYTTDTVCRITHENLHLVHSIREVF